MKVQITENQALFLKEGVLYFIQRNGKLYPMGNAKNIIGKDSITWDEFDCGISQKLIKHGYKIGITEAKTPGRVKIWNNSGFLKPGEEKLVYMYPHYFIDFIITEDIEELEDREDTSYIFYMSSKIKNIIYNQGSEENKELFKKQLADWLMNHEVYSIYLHRFVQDYVMPNYDRQLYVNKLKNKERPTDDEFRRFNAINIFKNGSSRTLNNFEYKDFLIP